MKEVNKQTAPAPTGMELTTKEMISVHSEKNGRVKYSERSYSPEMTELYDSER